MSIYLTPIISACYIFPFLAALFTLPYMMRQYHKYGALLLLRVGIVYSFIFYMMASYFMTVLPLPAIESVTPQSATVLLTPFDAVVRAAQSSGFTFTNPSSYIGFLTCPDALQIYFNILLLLPFGVYLRYYFHRKWYQVLILSFLYSLFFELTQLSGLYGIYPYPYRFFEVDDLICNTLGGMIGFFITPALLFFLPSKERLDELSYKKGKHVSVYRRLLGFIIDIAFSTFFLTLLELASHYTALIKLALIHENIQVYIFYGFVFFIITFIEIITHGKTLGKSIVNIQLKSSKEKQMGIQFLLRNILIYLVFLPGPYYVYRLIIYTENIMHRYEFALCTILSFIISFFIVYIIVDTFRCIVKRKKEFLYDRICKLTTISTVHSK